MNQILEKRKYFIRIVLLMLAIAMLIQILYLIKLPNLISEKSETTQVKTMNVSKQQTTARPLKLPDFKDNITDLKDDELFSLIDSDSNLALSYWKEWIAYEISDDWPGSNVDKCDTAIPWVEEINFNNIYWQVLTNLSRDEYYFLNAYYDGRQEEKVIRVISLKQRDATKEIWCLEYFEKKKQSLKVKADVYVEYYKTSKLNVAIVNCPVPKFVSHKIPRAVSIIGQDDCPDKVENSLRVISEKPKRVEERKDFAVCHKALRFSTIDLSFRLIEWIEMQRILGADLVQIYSLGSHPNIEKTLNYYQSQGHEQGKVVWRKYTIPGKLANIGHLYQKLSNTMSKNFFKMEYIEYYDCYYRNLNNYQFIGIFDLDEIIVPVNGHNWEDLFNEILNKPDFHPREVATYEFQGPRFFSDIQNNSPDIKNYTYTLKHPYRGILRKNEQVKAFHLTDKAKYFNHHYNRGCLDSNHCQTYHVDVELGYYLHYRIGWKVTDQCPSNSKPGNSTEDCVRYDPIIYKYRDELERRMEIVLAKIFGGDSINEDKKDLRMRGNFRYLGHGHRMGIAGQFVPREFVPGQMIP